MIEGAAPTRVIIPSIGVDAPGEVLTQDDVAREGGARPTESDVIAVYDGPVGKIQETGEVVRAGLPGSDSENTVYLYGHTHYEEAVLNYIKDIQAGDEIIVETPNGTLVYRVADGAADRPYYVVPKPLFSDHPEVEVGEPERLILTGCYRPNGDELTTEDNIFVVAYLSEVIPPGRVR